MQYFDVDKEMEWYNSENDRPTRYPSDGIRKQRDFTGRNNPMSKPVVMLDENGNKLRQFESANEASRHFNTNKSNINRAARGAQKSACGYLWMYLEDYNNLIKQTA